MFLVVTSSNAEIACLFVHANLLPKIVPFRAKQRLELSEMVDKLCVACMSKSNHFKEGLEF